jgi:Ala-tRNA(Pro) deacylase
MVTTTSREKLEAYLRENGVDFEIQRHPEAFTAQEVAASEHIPGKALAKVVMVLAEEKPVMLVLSAPDATDLERVSEVVGGKEVRLAREEEFSPLFPDCEPGAMPPFGNLYGIPVYVDESLSAEAEIYFQVGTHTETMRIRFADFNRLVRPTVVRFARRA